MEHVRGAMSILVSRRTLARFVCGGTATMALPKMNRAAYASALFHGNGKLEFPEGFLWGTATSSYQVEGAVYADGRGLSIWDTFAHTPGRIDGNKNGDVADDFYHLYRDDIQLLKSLGVKAFRFSVAWPRIFPAGTGAPEPRGLDFYQRMVDALLEAGIEPYCTLYHWDLPQPLQNRGGWENRDTAKAFAEYSGYMAGKLSDRVRSFMTMNEVRTFIENGNVMGTHAPGFKLNAGRIAQMSHYALLGHGLAVQAIRAQAKPRTRVGLADNVLATVPAIDAASYRAAARKAMREENAMYLTAVLEGRYTEGYLKRLGAHVPKFTAEEMRTIGSPIDFLGLNLYQPFYVRPDESEAGYAMIPVPASHPHMLSPWITVGPEVLYWAPKLVSDLWMVQNLYITENGTSSSDVLAADGRIYDVDRIMFLRNGLTQLRRAIAEGVPVKGYFLWSFLDNFEWADGYEKRFGIVYVDFATRKRMPKLSAEYYAQVIKENAVC